MALVMFRRQQAAGARLLGLLTWNNAARGMLQLDHC